MNYLHRATRVFESVILIQPKLLKLMPALAGILFISAIFVAPPIAEAQGTTATAAQPWLFEDGYYYSSPQAGVQAFLTYPAHVGTFYIAGGYEATSGYITVNGTNVASCAAAYPCYATILNADDGTSSYPHPATYELSGGPPAGVFCNDTSYAPSGQTCVPKSLGPTQPCNCAIPAPKPGAGDPIDIGSGNVFEEALDYETAGQNKLQFKRFYNSRASYFSLSKELGITWRSNYDRYIRILSSTSVIAERETGQQLTFTLSGGVWTSDSDVDVTLTQPTSTTWLLTDHDDSKEAYTADSTGFYALPGTITARDGYVQTLTWSGFKLTSVVDSYSRSLSFTYNSDSTLASVATPDSTTINFGYTAAGLGKNLTSVTYSNSGPVTITYNYASSTLPNLLTSITDVNGDTISSWSYDSYGRGLTSFQGGSLNAGLTTLTYNDSTGGRTVANALGVTDTYTFAVLQGVPKVSSISRAATSTTPSMSESFGYDSNGYLNSRIDWNGNSTTYINNSHGQPTTINEAVGSSVARTTTITYDPTWVHLPKTIVTAGLTTGYTYDGGGNPLAKVLTDTTSQTVPYSTNGQTRTWAYTFDSTGHVLTAKTPNSYTTQFTWDPSGTLTKVQNPLGQATQVTAFTAGSYPQTIVDPNGVSKTLTYDAQLRVTNSALTTSGGVLNTQFAYWFDNYLQKLTQPDASSITNTLDAALRTTKVTDNLGNYISYGLDALGNPTATNTYMPNGTHERQHSGTFDALGRMLTDVGAASQTTTFGDDNNGNALTVQNGRGYTTTNTFDALNRLSTSTDANGGEAQYSYDAHNRVLTVIDKNNHTTSYVYNGFGDVIQRTNPDVGKDIYHYDSDGNALTKLDASGYTTTWTFDALDRLLTANYNGDSTENESRTYDQTGTGFSFGIGRLTSVTDMAGSLTRAYDERGNLLTEKRTYSGNVYTTLYSYDKASRILTETYPSGTLVTYTRNAIGRVTNVATKAPGQTAVNLASGISKLPFGPLTAITAFNGDKETFSYDLDYRMHTLVTTGTNGKQNQTFTYDGDNNPSSISDTICTTCSGSFSYDTADRLLTASGWYGSTGYTVDTNGNQQTNNENASAATYNTVSSSNRLSSVVVGGTTYNVSYTGRGNISAFTRLPGKAYSLTFDKANHMTAASVSGGGSGSYVYDVFRQRFSKTVSGVTTLFFYDQSGNLLDEATSGTFHDYIWLENRGAIGALTPSTNTLAFLHGDKFGSPELVTDASALISTSFYYSPYQNTSTPTNQTGAATVTMNLRGPGQYFDAETLLNHNGARDYSPALGRYVQADPAGFRGGLNPYAFVGNRPMMFVDPSGLAPGDGATSQAEAWAQAMPAPPVNQTVVAWNSRHYYADDLGQAGDELAMAGVATAGIPGADFLTPILETAAGACFAGRLVLNADLPGTTMLDTTSEAAVDAVKLLPGGNVVANTVIVVKGAETANDLYRGKQ